jgi:hypothetical protein
MTEVGLERQEKISNVGYKRLFKKEKKGKKRETISKTTIII